MQIHLKNQIILVTGGVRGIGRAVTEACAEAGATVIATYLNNSASAEDFIGGLQSRGLKAHACRLDVRNAADVDAGLATIEQEYGSISVAINNAGVVKDNLVMSMDDGEWREVLETNLTGVFHVIRAVSRQMVRARRGAIINISSVAASRPGRGQCNYAASKGGLEAMTKALAVELSSKSIRVNAIAPGVIETEMSQEVRDSAGDKILETILLKRFGTPKDIAAMAVFLASDFGSYITGEIIHIDGGLKL